MTKGRTAAHAAAGGLSAWAAQRLLRARPPGGAERWRRSNHRGEPVTLLSGPALALAAGLATSPPALLAALGAGLVGRADDVALRTSAKGVRGHAAALLAGRPTSGTAKVVGIGATGWLASALLGGSRREVLVGAGVVAGTANLLNLLDLRPGRALKVGGLTALAVGQPGVAAACAALLPADLREQTMLGDCGANALGAVLGLGLLARHPSARGPALAVLVALTAASEVVSFSRVIDAVAPLRALDRAGRRS